jgi:hypothetical protein
VPVPLSVVVCGEAAALSATERVAAKLADEAGVKVTEIVQDALTASVVPQVVALWVKSLGLAPVILMPIPVSGALPVLVSVATCAAVVVPVAAVKLREVGVRVAVATTAEVMVNVDALDVPPPGAGFVTVTAGVPTLATSLARIAAVTWLALTKVVVLALPPKFTTEPLTKLDPFTVSVKAPDPAVVLAGSNEVIAGRGLLAAVMLKVTALDVPPPGAGFVTVTAGVPTFATSLAGIAAVIWFALT